MNSKQIQKNLEKSLKMRKSITIKMHLFFNPIFLFDQKFNNLSFYTF